MLKKFLKSKKKLENAGEMSSETADENSTENKIAPTQKPRLFGRLVSGLSKTRQNLSKGLSSTFLGKKQIDDDLLEDIEMLLLSADVGAEACQQFMDALQARLKRKTLTDAEAVMHALKEDMLALLSRVEMPLTIPDHHDGPFVILMIGINGAGKTTTIGKMAKQLQQQGKSVMLAAGDTFRAAAVEQLQTWGERNHIPVIAQQTGADSASVAFDAYQSAKAKNCDVLIVDTAGRLHTQNHLMAELKKIKRVIGKIDETAPHEVMLILDASIGQNALIQAEQFLTAVDVTSLTMTKLDGTAKGGILFAIAKKLTIPIRFIGVGENIDDLRPFKAREFMDALLP